MIVLSVLLLPLTQADAQKPIPGITATKDFKVLKNYVNNDLYPKRNTPANVETTTADRAELRSKATSAYQKVKALSGQKPEANKNVLRRANNKAKAVQKKAVAKINKNYYANLDRDEAAYHRAVARVTSEYALLLSNYTSQLRMLAKKLKKAKNKAVRLDIKE